MFFRRSASMSWLNIAVWIVLFTTIVVAVIIFYTRPAAGATYTWDGGGSTNDWSECANWSSNICPGSGDLARFDGTSVKDATVDGSFGGSVLGVDINSGYNGVITQARNLTIGTSGYDQAAGTWRQHTYTFDINDSGFVVSNGTFEAAAGTNTINRDFTYSGGTITASSTRVFYFDGTTSVHGTIVTCTGDFPSPLNFSKTNSTFTLSSGCNATTSGAVSTGSIGGSFSNAGKIYFAGTVDFNGGFGLTNTGTVILGGNVTMHGNFNDSGTFTDNGYTVTFDGTNTGHNTTLTCTGDFETTIGISKSNSAFTIASGCAATTTGAVTTGGDITVQGRLRFSSTVDLNGGFTNTGTTVLNGTLFVTQSFTQNGTVIPGSNTVTLDGNLTGNDTTISCSGDVGVPINFAKTSGGADVVVGSNCIVETSSNNTTSGAVTVNGTLILDGRNLTALSLSVGSAGTLRLFGSQTLTTPSISEGATIDFNGTGSYTTLNTGYDFENVIFSSGTYTIGNAMTVEDNITNSDATFTHSGTLTLDGANQTVTGNNTFNNLTKIETATTTLTFEAGSTQTVSGTLTLQGASAGNRLVLASSVPGELWYITPVGTRNLTYLAVSDSRNNSTTIYCDPGCVDEGNNVKWVFGPPPEPETYYRLQGGVRLQGGARL